jgi:hypothetical protein
MNYAPFFYLSGAIFRIPCYCFFANVEYGRCTQGIHSGHCKVLDINRKSSVRECHYSFLKWEKCLLWYKAVIH